MKLNRNLSVTYNGLALLKPQLWKEKIGKPNIRLNNSSANCKDLSIKKIRKNRNKNVNLGKSSTRQKKKRGARLLKLNN
jgi:hypothetical protein